MVWVKVLEIIKTIYFVPAGSVRKRSKRSKRVIAEKYGKLLKISEIFVWGNENILTCKLDKGLKFPFVHFTPTIKIFAKTGADEVFIW